MALRAFIFFILIIQSLAVLGVTPQQQEVFYHQFEKSDGLLSNTVYDINLNENGEIIFGTDRGLSIYNGLTFNNRTYIGASNALNDVHQIGQEAYIGTNFDWEYVFFRKDTTEVLALNKSGLDFPRVIPLGDQKLLYIKTGLISLDQQDTIHFKNSLDFLYHIVQHGNTTWFTAGDTEENTLYKLEANGRLSTISLGFSMTKEDIPFAYNEGILFYRPSVGGITDLKGKLIQSLPFTPEKVNNLYIHEHNLYFSTLNGLWVFNLASRNAEQYLTNIQISDTMFDVEGNLWCSSLLHGVFMIPSLTRRVINFEDQLNESLILQSQQNGPGNALLLTNDSKLYELDYSDFSLTFKRKVSSPNRIEGFLADSTTGTIYLGSSLAELLDANSLVTLKSFKLSAIKGFLPSKEKLFMATSSGLYVYHSEKQLAELILPKHRLRGLFRQKGQQYCYSANKLWEIAEDDSLKLILDQQNIEKVVYSESRTFILTTTGGVSELKENKLEPIIQSGEDYSDIFLTNNYLFVINSERADVLDLKTFEKRNSFFNSKGIDTNKLVAVVEFDGQLLFLHQQFMSAFSSFPERNLVKPTIKLLNRDLLPEKLTSISYSSNDLRFAFGVYPNISAQGKTSVMYRIKGLSQDWLPLYATKGSYNIDLLNLANGQYELELKAENEDGVTSEAFLLPFSIKPPLWRQNSMLLLYVVILGGIFWTSFYLNRLRLVRKNKAELEKVRLNNQLAAAELKAIRSQMNPHFLFNAMATIQNAILKKDLKDSLDGLSSLSKLLRDVLHKSSMEMHSVQAEIDFLHNYLKLSKKRFGEEFEYEITCDKEIDTAFEKIPTLITQPFVENAIEHGVSKRKGAKHISIAFSRGTKGYQVIIRDNGLGSDPTTWYNEERGSFALKAIENRISRVNKLSKLKVGSTISSASEGTTVTLTFEHEQ
ncbi:MAG: histidine kinase [Roseivirga sp.]|jgi:ligand-binding sensor domain-containing protein/two-component sensor histidine kinase|uniref:sensor histidine kinase n=1 Tax=Roseivirga sp. TaxID=1964215 RepID=UPI001B06EE8E|nr:histidine kinase [Roseivirga sp.]MBO6495502.1 histidine kinase [Roseivirga sp.]